MASTYSPDVNTNNVTWELSVVERYFKIVGQPAFGATKNAFIVTLEATEDGSCALEPLGCCTFFGFEAIFIGDSNRKIHTARDIGSATEAPAPAEAYIQVSPDRVRVEPQQWTAGT